MGPRVLAPATDSALLWNTLEIMERYNVVGVFSGPMPLVRRWRAAGVGTRVIPAAGSFGEIPLDSMRAWARDGTIRVMGELAFQYVGISPTDSLAEAHFALAEQLDLPVGVHVGPGRLCHIQLTGVAWAPSSLARARVSLTARTRAARTASRAR